MENLDLYRKYAAVPQNAQKAISGGRLNGKTDINPMWRIKSLTEEFGACGNGWYYEVLNKWIEKSETGEIAGFVDINLFVKYDGEWSKPIYGVGGSMFVAKEKAGLYTSDEVFKMATTDAISVACKQLGFGADIYWGADRTKYSTTPKAELNPKLITEAKALNIQLEKLAVYYKCEIGELTDEMLAEAITLKKAQLDKEQK